MSSIKERFTALREHRPALDHLIRAVQRYQADTGDRLAASVTFFGFLSFFPLLALSASLLGVYFGDTAAEIVAREVNSLAPGLADELGLVDLLQENRQALGLASVASLGGLLFAGLGWIDAMREAVRTVWHQNVKAGNVVKKKALDVVILAGLGATLLVSLAVSAAAGAFTDVALRLAGIDEDSLPAQVTVTVLGTVLALLTSTGLFLYLFTRLPKVQTPWRRVLRGAVLAAVLFEVLKRVGAIYVERTTENPLYGAFAVVVGLLVWINLVSRMLLFCAAWTVTAPFDSDVAPSGTANAEQARRAGIPEEFADGDPDEPPTIQKDGAPSPLLAATMGRTPPQDQPEGPPSRRHDPREARRRGRVPADRSAAADAGLGAGRQAVARAGLPTDPYPDEPARPAPGEVATRRVAQAGAALISAGLVGVGVYAVRTAVGVLRR
jgi:membrane protein